MAGEQKSINYQKGVGVYGGDDALYKSLLSSFETMSLTPNIKEMHDNWIISNYKQMKKIAFELQGAAGFIFIF